MKKAIFKPGTHTSSQGSTRTWTEEDCRNMVQAYNEQAEEDRKDAPLILGHTDKDSTPAFGWVKELSFDGRHVWAHFKEVKDEFKGWVEDALYGPVSASLRADGTLKHVAALGATPPAIGGLPSWVFNEEEGDETYEFSDYRVTDMTGLFRRLREHLISTVSLEVAEQVLPAEILDRLASEPYDDTQWLRQEVAELRGIVSTLTDTNTRYAENDPMKGNPTGGAGSTPAPEPENQPAPPVDYSEQLNQRDEKIAKLTTAVETQNAVIAQLQARNQEADFREFLAGDELKGRVVPANRELALSMLKNAATLQGEFNYAEGDEAKKGTALDAMKAQIKAWPKIVEFGEIATRVNARNRTVLAGTGFEFGERDDVDMDALAIHERALAISAEKSIDYAEAVTIARREAR